MKKYLLLSLFVITSCTVKQLSENRCKYDIMLYYLGGSTDTVHYIVNEIYEPYIYGYKGSYTFMMSAYQPEYSGTVQGGAVQGGPIRVHQIPGVVRFKVLRKQVIK